MNYRLWWSESRKWLHMRCGIRAIGGPKQSALFSLPNRRELLGGWAE